MNQTFLRKGGGRVRSFVNSRFGRIVTSMLLLVIGLFTLVNLVAMPVYTRQGTARLIPDLTLKPAQSARQAADSAGFELIMAHGKVSARVPEGWIIEQHPSPGTLAKPGRKIRVIPAIGAAADVAPDLVGLELRDAQLRCKNVGLVSGPTEVRYRFSSRVTKGKVVEQDPRAGAPVKPGSVVKLVVSMGPEPAHFYVPSLLSYSLSDARAMLREAGLQMGKIRRVESAEYPPGTVISQSIGAGQSVESGTEVDVVVAVQARSAKPDPAQPGDAPPQPDNELLRQERRNQDQIDLERARQDSIRRSRRRY